MVRSGGACGEVYGLLRGVEPRRDVGCAAGSLVESRPESFLEEMAVGQQCWRGGNRQGSLGGLPGEGSGARPQ